MSKRDGKLKIIFANHPNEKAVFMTSDDRAFFAEHNADAHGQTLPDKEVKMYTQAGLLAVEAIRSKIEAKRDAAVGGLVKETGDEILKQVQDDNGELTLPAAGVTEASDEDALIAKAEEITTAKLNAELEAEKSDNPGKEAEEKAKEEGAVLKQVQDDEAVDKAKSDKEAADKAKAEKEAADKAAAKKKADAAAKAKKAAADKAKKEAADKGKAEKEAAKKADQAPSETGTTNQS